MKRCNACDIDIKENTMLCPLCSNALEDKDGVVEEILYPNLVTNPPAYHFVRKVLFFLSVVAAVSSVVTNFFVTPNVLWCMIILTGIVYFWVAISNIIRENTNFAFKVLVQVISACLLVIAIDIQTGRIGWSFSYVVPTILCAGIIAIMVLVIFNRTNWARYVLYQSLLAFFGFAPIILYMLGLSKNLILSIIPTFIAFLSLTATFIFGDKTIKNEFKRRLHF